MKALLQFYFRNFLAIAAILAGSIAFAWLLDFGGRWLAMKGF